MFALNEMQKMIQDMMRQYCTKEIQPHVEKMEDGEVSCFDLARKMIKMFGGEAMIKPALEKLAKKREEGEKAGTDLAKLLGGGDEAVVHINDFEPKSFEDTLAAWPKPLIQF